MIIFENLKWKNFLSTGNSYSSINFVNHKSNLIVGHNGSGKSTMLDALSFALFGKAHRNISKPQLVNTINNKDCIVAIEFNVSGSAYKVVRGIKPNKFEIWKDGTMINQSSHAKEYQKILEQNIIKLNHKSFHQIVVLGSSSFIPFMQLPAQHRRDVIEDLLDINVFSKMNQILKEKNSILKDDLKGVDYDADLNKEKVDLQNKYIKEVEALSVEQINSKETDISNAQEEIDSFQRENVSLSAEIEERSDGLQEGLKENHDKRQSLLHYQAEFNQKIKTLVKETKFYEENDTCPTCTQDISPDVRDTKLEAAKEKAGKLSSAVRDVSDRAAVVESTIERLTNTAGEIRDKTSIITSNNKTIGRLQEQIASINSSIEQIRGSGGDLSKSRDELETLKKLKDDLFEKRLYINESLSYNTVILEMLKDTGIKTKIIKQYLPVINNLVNKYLQVLDFFVSFYLDEAFSETIKSRHRDNFSYDSFSEGEKQRIDLALLFTWRQIAKMKNSVSTNLLMLDETFDSSLDYEGVDNLMKIIQTLGDDTNVFVISHKGEMLDGRFDNKIEVYKEKNFSKIKGN